MERSERVVRSKAEVVDCRKRTMPLPSERFFAVGSRSELGMDEEDHPGDYGSAPLRVRGVIPYQRPLGTVSGGLSLPAIRVLPVALSLLRTHLARVSVLFAGWFGPRGLASIVLGLIVVAAVLGSPGGMISRWWWP